MTKTAVVTGASYGLGEAISAKLLELGYKVYGVSRTPLKLESSNLVWIKADLLDDSELASISTQIKESSIDLLVNNVGTAFLQKTLDYTDADFEKMFALNFKVHVKITKLLFSRLAGGLILNTSSLSDRYPDSKWGLYGSSKAALNLFFETMAVENDQVKIINLLPSYVDTPLQHALHDQSSFDWDLCMTSAAVADAVGSVIQHQAEIASGSRVIIVKDAEVDDQYNPEKLWVYEVSSGAMKKIR